MPAELGDIPQGKCLNTEQDSISNRTKLYIVKNIYLLRVNLTVIY